MCVPINDRDMLGWLKSQLQVIDAWRVELIMRPESEIGMLERLERHYAWLIGEIARLEAAQRAGQASTAAAY